MATFVGAGDEQQGDYDVVIVGAGISGLFVNHTLIHTYGVSPDRILVVDAQDYIGGRIRQADDFVPNGLIELGAEILHGEETLLTQIGRELGEPMKSLYVWAHGDGGPMEEPVDRHYGLYYFAGSERLLRFDADDADFQRLNEALWKIAEFKEEDFPAETTLEDYLRREGCSEEAVSMANAGYANTLCTKGNKLALRQVVRWGRQWDTEGENDGDFKFKSTFRCLIEHFKRSLHAPNVLLNTPVQRVVRPDAAAAGGLVAVHTADDRRFLARAVVVTASVHVLQRPELLRFEPPLPPQYTAALQSAVMHRAMKIFVRFSAPFWPVGLQGMIMAPPAEEASEVTSLFVPEVWFNALPCDAHAACYAHADPAQRGHPSPRCEHCSYYVTGFATSDFAGNLDDAFERDADVCDVLVRQLDRVFAKLRPAHHLRPDEYVGESSSDEDEGDSSSDEDDEEGRPAVPALPLPSDVFLSGRVQRWTPRRHPYIGGGYASGLPTRGDLDLAPGDYARIVSERGLDNAVFFAGEGVNFPAGATAHAALESAQRAARNVAVGVLGRSDGGH
eukprot:gene12059-8615_t